jgi:hypothetical protein
MDGPGGWPFPGASHVSLLNRDAILSNMAAMGEEQGQQTAEEPMLYCPTCDARLISRKCKLLCERCGYYMSCADYY